MADFLHERSARGPRSLALIGIAVVVLLGMVFVVGAALWVIAIFALLTIPAIYDALRGARARLVLNDLTLGWESGRREQMIPLGRIEEVTLSTSLDFSQRATVQLTTGEKLRIPPECLPGGRLLDAELEARGIPHRRSLFSF